MRRHRRWKMCLARQGTAAARAIRSPSMPPRHLHAVPRTRPSGGLFQLAGESHRLSGGERPAHHAVNPDLRCVLAGPVALTEMQAERSVLGVLFHPDTEFGLQDVADSLSTL